MPEEKQTQITSEMIANKIEQARQSPESKLAKQLRVRLDSGKFDDQLVELGLERGVQGLEKISQPESTDIDTEISTEEIQTDGAAGVTDIEKPGIIQRVGQRIGEKVTDVTEGIKGAAGKLKGFVSGFQEEQKEFGEGEQALGSTILQVTGEGAKALSGIAEEAVTGRIKTLLTQEQEEAIKSDIENVTRQFVTSDFFNTVRQASREVGQKTGISEAIESLSQEQKDNLAAVGDIAMLALDAAGAGATGKVATVGAKTTKKAVGEAGEQIGKAISRIDEATDVARAIDDTSLSTVAKEASPEFREALENRLSGQAKALQQIARETIPTRKGFRDKQIIRALDINQGDLKKIERKTGNEVGTFIADNQLIRNTPQATSDAIEAFQKSNMTRVDDAIGRVTRVIEKNEVPFVDKMLNQMLAHVSGVPGLEETTSKIKRLIELDNFTLTDLQASKRLFDEVENVFSKATGEVSSSFQKKGLANLRGDLKRFIEKEVKSVDKTVDIAKLNNNVATSNQIVRALTIADNRFLTRNAASLGDFFTFGAFAGPVGVPLAIAAVAGKKLLESPSIRLRIARILNNMEVQKARQIADEINTATFSDESRRVIEQAVQQAAQAQG